LNEASKPNIFKNFKTEKNLLKFNKIPETVEEAIEELFLKIFNIEDQLFLINFKKLDKKRKDFNRVKI
jgi:hypothetical protein